MGLELFSELDRTNAAYCRALGFSSAELYGTPPNPAELSTHRLIAAGVPSEAADPYVRRMEAERLRVHKLVVDLQRKIRLRNVGYAPGRFKRLVNCENYIRGIA